MLEWMHCVAVVLAAPLVIWGAVGFWRGLSLKPNDPKTRPRAGAGGLIGMPWW